jgi:hypothetical protein
MDKDFYVKSYFYCLALLVLYKQGIFYEKTGKQHALLELIRIHLYFKIFPVENFSCSDNRLKLLHSNGFYYQVTTDSWTCHFNNNIKEIEHGQWPFKYSFTEPSFNETSFSNNDESSNDLLLFINHGTHSPD